MGEIEVSNFKLYLKVLKMNKVKGMKHGCEEKKGYMTFFFQFLIKFVLSFIKKGNINKIKKRK